MGAIRKILTTGVGAALMTENGIRNAFSDIKLTRQATDYIARQAQKGKEEFTKVFAGELKRFLDHVDLHKALAGMKLHIEATITVGPKEGGREKVSVSVRRLKIRRK